MPKPPADSMPDSWDFDPEFLSNPAHLPPYLASHDSPALGPARRATAADVQPWFRSATDQDGPDRAPHGIVLSAIHAIVDDRRAGRYRVHGPCGLVLGELLLNRHLLMVGPPGVGKTTQGIQPITARLLADRGRSVVVFDPKGDQFGVVRDLAVAAGRRARTVVRLNLTDPQGSVGWNPLRHRLGKTEAHGIANSLVMAVESKVSHDSPYWRNNSIELITSVLLGLAQDPDETLTLPRLYEVLDLPRKELMEWLHGHGAHRFATFLESGSHNAETCLTDASMRLVSLQDLDLCAVLSQGELKLTHLFQKPMVLVVEMDETRIERLRPIFNLLVQQILDRGIEVASSFPDARLPFPVSVVIDEFGSAIGSIPRFPTTLNTLRSRRISVIAAVQSITQIQSLYGGEAGAVLAGFSSKLFFPNVEPVDAEFASLMCGTMTVPLPAAPGQPVPLVSRRTYLPEEIARPVHHPVLGRPVTILLADAPAVQAYLPPSYRLPELGAVLRAQRRKRVRPRRRKPLVYVPRRPAPTRKSRFLDVRGLTATSIHKHVQETELRLALAAAPVATQQAWTKWRLGAFDTPAAALRFLEELLHRGMTFPELHAAWSECRAEIPALLLMYVDYYLARRQLQGHERGPL